MKYILPVLFTALITSMIAISYVGNEDLYRGGQWYFEYKYNGFRKLYIVSGDKIDSYNMFDYIVLDKRHVLVRDSIITQNNSTAYGKQAAMSLGSDTLDVIDEHETMYYDGIDYYYSTIPIENIITIN